MKLPQAGLPRLRETLMEGLETRSEHQPKPWTRDPGKIWYHEAVAGGCCPTSGRVARQLSSISGKTGNRTSTVLRGSAVGATDNVHQLGDFPALIGLVA